MITELLRGELRTGFWGGTILPYIPTELTLWLLTSVLNFLNSLHSVRSIEVAEVLICVLFIQGGHGKRKRSHDEGHNDVPMPDEPNEDEKTRPVVFCCDLNLYSFQPEPVL